MVPETLVSIAMSHSLSQGRQNQWELGALSALLSNISWHLTPWESMLDSPQTAPQISSGISLSKAGFLGWFWSHSKLEATPAQLTDCRVELHRGKAVASWRDPKWQSAWVCTRMEHPAGMNDKGQDPSATSPGYTAGQTGFAFTAAPSLASSSRPPLLLPEPLTSHPFRHQTTVKHCYILVRTLLIKSVFWFSRK